MGDTTVFTKPVIVGRNPLSFQDKEVPLKVELPTKPKTEADSFTTKRKNEGATSAEFDGMLARLAAGGELPSKEEVERIGNAQVAALAKKGVPKENQEAIREILNSAYAMRDNANDPAKFKEAREKYLGALNNKKMWWTISQDELKQFRSTLGSIEGKQPNEQKPKLETEKKQELDKQVKEQQLRTRTDPRRTDPRRAKRNVPKRPAQKKRPQQLKPFKTGVADLRMLDDAEMTAMNAKQEADRLRNTSGDKQKIRELDRRAADATRRAAQIRKQLELNAKSQST